MSIVGKDVILAYVLEFKAKSESVMNPLPRSFTVMDLTDFVGPLGEERSLCSVQVSRCYLEKVKCIASVMDFICVSE